MNTCIYSRAQFSDSDGEHIIQNFLGARWTSSVIVSDSVQCTFGQTIDISLEKGLQPIRNLLGTQGGRGGTGPILKGIVTTANEVIDLEPGGKPRIAQPVVIVEKRPDGSHAVKMTLGTIRQLGWALAMLREQIPDLKVDINQARSLAQSVSGFISGQAQLEIGIGGRDYFRGVLKSCMNLLGACDPARALEPCFDKVRSFVLSGQGDISDFARWSKQAAPLKIPSLGRADHFIGISSLRGGVEGIVQYFGEVIHPVRLSASYTGEPFQCSYLVNPFRDTTPAEERNPAFQTSCIPSFIDQDESSGPDTWGPFKMRLERLVRLYFDTADQTLVTQAIDEILKPEEGKLFTTELAGRFSQRLAELFAHRLRQMKEPQSP